MSEKRKTKKKVPTEKALTDTLKWAVKEAIKAKDKRSSAKTVATLQRDYQAKIRKYLLHLFNNRTARCKLAHWSLICEGQPGSVSQIRLTCSETPVLQMQHSSRGEGSRLLRKDAKGNRPQRNGKTPKRSASKRKSNRSLSKALDRLHSNTGKLKVGGKWVTRETLGSY